MVTENDLWQINAKSAYFYDLWSIIHKGAYNCFFPKHFINKQQYATHL